MWANENQAQNLAWTCWKDRLCLRGQGTLRWAGSDQWSLTRQSLPERQAGQGPAELSSREQAKRFLIALSEPLDAAMPEASATPKTIHLHDPVSPFLKLGFQTSLDGFSDPHNHMTSGQ